jgi:hypothetical protein
MPDPFDHRRPPGLFDPFGDGLSAALGLGAHALRHRATPRPANPQPKETPMRKMFRRVLVATFLGLAATPQPLAACEAPHAQPARPVLGLAITTQDPAARALFEAGLGAYWTGDAASALHAFRAAQAADPACAICHWGEALALGPRPQTAMPSAHIRPAWEAILRAEALAAKAGPLERDLIAALRHRYGINAMVLRDGLDFAWATAIDRVAAEAGDVDLVRLLAGEAQAILRHQDLAYGG